MSARHCNPAISAPDAHIAFGVQGYYALRIMKADADGNPIESTAREFEFPNLITNQGMDAMGDSVLTQAWAECVVGTGNTPPQFTDTALQSQVASTSTWQVVGVIDRQVATTPRWVQFSRTWRFAVGAAAGNLAEVGIRRNSSPFQLFSRALIVDAVGNPTTLTVLSGEVLDVTYRIRYFIPENDVTGTVTLNGTVYNWTMRPVNIGSNPTGDSPGWPGLPVSGGGDYIRGIVRPNNDFNGTRNCVATVPMVAIDQLPVLSGISRRGATSVSYGAYTPGSFFIDSIVTWPLTEGNSSGIQLAVITFEFGSFQIGFSPSFTKLDTQQLRFTVRASWARRP